jgi:hypothetical protein
MVLVKYDPYPGGGTVQRVDPDEQIIFIPLAGSGHGKERAE